VVQDENLARASDTYEGKAGYDLQPRSAVELELQTGDSLFVWRTFSPEWVYAENQGSCPTQLPPFSRSSSRG
jgi:hypothetical protein